jgi:hypothetical protein
MDVDFPLIKSFDWPNIDPGFGPLDPGFGPLLKLGSMAQNWVQNVGRLQSISLNLRKPIKKY